MADAVDEADGLSWWPNRYEWLIGGTAATLVVALGLIALVLLSIT